MKFLSNTWQKLSSMSTGKKVYAGMWALTGALMISLIGMFVGLNDKYKLSTPKDQTGWTVKAVNAEAGVSFPKYDQYSVQVIKTGDVVDVTGATQKLVKDAYVSLDKAKLVEDFKIWFDQSKPQFTGSTKDSKALYEVDKWETVLTNEAKDAVNATAAVGALFGAALIGTVFTTVGVSMHEKRKRTGGKK